MVSRLASLWNRGLVQLGKGLSFQRLSRDCARSQGPTYSSLHSKRGRENKVVIRLGRCPVDCTMGLSVSHGEIRYHTEQVWSVTSEQPQGCFVVLHLGVLYGWLWELLFRELTQRRFWATHMNRCEASFILICLISATKFVWLSVFTFIETICRKTWANPLPKHATSPLKLDVSRSKMSFLKLLIVFCIASFGHRIICNTEKL